MKVKPLGIVRKIDELGRIVIPKEVRRQNGWKTGTPVEMLGTEDGSGLVIRPYALSEHDTVLRALEVKKDFVEDVRVKKAIDLVINTFK